MEEGILESFHHKWSLLSYCQYFAWLLIFFFLPLHQSLTFDLGPTLSADLSLYNLLLVMFTQSEIVVFVNESSTSMTKKNYLICEMYC